MRKPIKTKQVFPGGGDGRGTTLEKKEPLSTSLKFNLQRIRSRVGENSDLVIREFEVSLYHLPVAIIYIDGLVDSDLVQTNVIKSLMLESAKLRVSEVQPAETGTVGEPAGTAAKHRRDSIGPQGINLKGPQAFAAVKTKLVAVAGTREISTVDQAILAFLSADAVLLVDGSNLAMVLSVRGFATRGIAEPGTETLIRGPREGFVESLRINTSMLRRRLRDPNFKLIGMQLGRRTSTDCAVAYIEDIVDPDLLARVQQRLARIDIDAVLESGYLEQLIEDSWLSPLPQVQYTERPDKVVAALLEGRVAILVDGTPFALIVPTTFLMFFQSPEDYYERWILGSVTRILRIAASYIATFLPGIYVAIIAYHPGLLPGQLAMTLAAAREGVPFPAVVEALLMEVSFEFFREAGARLPGPIGQTVGIVGGLIIGEAAVSANLASPAMIIVVALTAIAGFSIPSYNLGVGFRLIRFPLMLAGATLGLYGVVMGFIIINIHMVTMKTFGVVYLEPLAPYRFRDWKDMLLRVPLRAMRQRPQTTGARQPQRQSDGKKGGHRE